MSDTQESDSVRTSQISEGLSLLTQMVESGIPAEDVRAKQFDLGLAWVWFPVGHGGLDAHPDLQDEIDQTMSEAGLPEIVGTSGIAVSMSAPTIARHGTEEQRKKFLRRIFTGNDVWCQLFSEPGSGSDLAGLSTRAVRDGDDWVLNGQKVWTSFADVSDWALILARHDPELPKHAGLTYFALDMRTPGIELRPLREMTGEGQFSEVFITDVRIPDAMRVGPVGEGWRVSLDTLSNERAGRGEPLGASAIDTALQIWKARAKSGGTSQGAASQPSTNQGSSSQNSQGQSDAVERARLADLWTRSQVNRFLTLRGHVLREAGTNGPEGSLSKLAAAELAQEIYSFCLNLEGASGMTMPTGYGDDRVERGQDFLVGRELYWLFLRSRGFTIEGGTSQIQRNVIAERILGLPSDGKSQRTTPWNQITRSI